MLYIFILFNALQINFINGTLGCIREIMFMIGQLKLFKCITIS